MNIFTQGCVKMGRHFTNCHKLYDDHWKCFRQTYKLWSLWWMDVLLCWYWRVQNQVMSLWVWYWWSNNDTVYTCFFVFYKRRVTAVEYTTYTCQVSPAHSIKEAKLYSNLNSWLSVTVHVVFNRLDLFVWRLHVNSHSCFGFLLKSKDVSHTVAHWSTSIF